MEIAAQSSGPSDVNDQTTVAKDAGTPAALPVIPLAPAVSTVPAPAPAITVAEKQPEPPPVDAETATPPAPVAKTEKPVAEAPAQTDVTIPDSRDRPAEAATPAVTVATLAVASATPTITETPKPPPKPKSKPVPKAVSGTFPPGSVIDTKRRKPSRRLAKPGYVVQLSSVRTAAGARREARRLTRALGLLLKGKRLRVQKAVARGRGTVYRLNLAGFPNRSGARKLCARIKARSLNCLVMKR